MLEVQKVWLLHKDAGGGFQDKRPEGTIASGDVGEADVDSDAPSRQAPDRPCSSTHAEVGAAASGGGAANESAGLSESNVRKLGSQGANSWRHAFAPREPSALRA